MAATDRSLLDLEVKHNFSDDDTVVSVISGQASRISLGVLKDGISQWGSINNKPFTSLDSDDFTITTDIKSGSLSLSINPLLKNDFHDHTNKIYLDKIGEDNDGKLLYNNYPVTSENKWDTLLNKPFNDISKDDFSVDENNIMSLSESIKNQLHTHENYEVISKFSVDTEGKLLFDKSPIISDGIDFAALSAMLAEGNNITIATDEATQKITISALGIDFAALTEALTSGTQSGISVTADTENSRINFEVTGLPEIAIDSEGYWTIDGVRGDNPTKAQGENGADGISPSIDAESRHWFIGETDTGVKAEGNDGYSPNISLTTTDTGVDIEITNKDGIQHATLLNGQDGAPGKDGVTTVQTSKVDKTCILTAGNWSNTVPYTQTVSVEGITELLNPRIDIIVSDDIETGKKEEAAFSCITKVITGDGVLTAYCYENKPDVDLNIMIEVI